MAIELSVIAWAGWWNSVSAGGANSDNISVSEPVAGGMVVMMGMDAPESVSVHELDSPVPLSMLLVGAGDSVVTENSGAVLVLSTTDPLDER
jgi:hypothetical protein